MKITTNQILKITEEAIDKIGEITGQGFTESEECHLAIAVNLWCVRMGVEVVESEGEESTEMGVNSGSES